jgi:predicted SprT family Zn-dependent metalloprotease
LQARPALSGARGRVSGMKTEYKCTCAKPLLQEHSDQKGSSQSWCGRCKKPLSLRVALFRSPFA